MQIVPSPCDSCVHRLTRSACEAFDEIPSEFIALANPHNVPAAGQKNGIVWEFAPGAEAEFESWKTVLETTV